MIRRFLAWFSRGHLWQKLLTLYLAVSILPILTLSLTAYFISQRIMYDQIRVRLYDYTRNTAAYIRSSQQLYETVLDTVLYDDDFLQNVAWADEIEASRKELQVICQDLWNALNTTTSGMENIQIVLTDTAEDGSPLMFSAIENELAPPVQKTLAQPPDKALYITSDTEHAYLFRQVINPYSGVQLATVVITVQATDFFGVSPLDNIAEYALIVRDGQGHDLYAKTSLLNFYGKIEPNHLRQTDSHEIWLLQRAFLYNPYYMEDLDWTVSVLVPKDILYAGFSDIVLITIAVTLFCIVAVSLFSIRISFSLSRRLEHICQEMARVGSGRLDVNLSVQKSNDEIDHLAYIFQEMVDKLNNLIIEKYKNEIAQKEAQFKILQAQINPHFLYNCMDTINWRAIMNGDTKTSELVTNLSAFYRTCLNKGNAKIQMKDEIRNIKAYIALQLDLHDNSFAVDYAIDPSIYPYEAVNLILQPLVENAIEHGIEKDVSGQPKLTVIARSEAQQGTAVIVIHICNTGPSIDPETARQVLADSQRGYGLANVHKRIQLYYGTRYGVTLEPIDGGTRCRVVIPQILWEEAPREN